MSFIICPEGAGDELLSDLAAGFDGLETDLGAGFFLLLPFF